MLVHISRKDQSHLHRCKHIESQRVRAKTACCGHTCGHLGLNVLKKDQYVLQYYRILRCSHKYTHRKHNIAVSINNNIQISINSK